MKKYLYIIVVVVVLGFLFAVSFGGSNSSKNVSSVDGVSFEESFVNTENAVLLDVRTPLEYNEGHIKGAINIDFQNPNFNSEIEKLDKNLPYFVYCRSGNRSTQAVNAMQKAGFTNITQLEGGLMNNEDLLQKDFAQENISIDLGDDSVSLELSVASATLSEKEIADLLYMREEEKLAHDVYITLGEKWKLNIFNNIASSEQTHTNAVRSLLDVYKINDIADGNGVGEFTNTELKALYEDLVKQGSVSLVEALRVGALIEDLDISDLEKALASTAQSDIQNVYNNLQKGSRNHLRSFTSQLAKQGVEYTPQYIPVSVYENIVGSPKETGRQ